jgi:drug/metabolite transporter (DMT)-like permease
MVWGSGDFVGGAATRRSHQFQVLALSALSGIVLLTMLAWIFEPLPSRANAAWAAAAGLAGAVGIASLYHGLAVGGAAMVAPVAAVVTAAIPAVYTAFAVAPPSPWQLAGFLAAVAGIWLVTRQAEVGPAEAGPYVHSRTPEDSWTPPIRQTLQTPKTLGLSRLPRGVRQAVVAGIGFGTFLILIAQVDRTLVFGPLVVARTVMLAMGLVLMIVRGISFPGLTSNPLALVAGALDAGGNIFFVLARQHTRLDVAAVLSSLYPVATVVLARIVWREPVAPQQWAGVGMCLLAVALMAE